MTAEQIESIEIKEIGVGVFSFEKVEVNHFNQNVYGLFLIERIMGGYV